MEMTEVFDKLKGLQTVLVEKYEIEKKIEDAPKQLFYLEGLVKDLKKKYIERNAQYEELKAKVNSLSLELDEAVKAKESGEKMMDNIETHREYEALEKQISEAAERERGLRDSLRGEQDKLTTLTNGLRDDETFIQSQQGDLDKMRADMQSTVDGYNERLSELAVQEKDIEGNLGEYQETVYKFHSIIRRNSEGIVAVKSGVCTGCQMILPAQFANDVRKGDNISFCPYCSRILFYEETKEGEEEDYTSLVELGSLQGDDLDKFDEDDDSDFGGDFASSDSDSDSDAQTDEDEQEVDEDSEEEGVMSSAEADEF